MIDLENDFIRWLIDELNRRDWSQARLARRGEFSRSALSRILNGRRQVGFTVAVKIANALNLPHELVLQKAGLINFDVFESQDLSELATLFEQLPEFDQEEILLIVRHRHQLTQNRHGHQL